MKRKWKNLRPNPGIGAKPAFGCRFFDGTPQEREPPRQNSFPAALGPDPILPNPKK
jgi:hypothetical protein